MQRLSGVHTSPCSQYLLSEQTRAEFRSRQPPSAQICPDSQYVVALQQTTPHGTTPLPQVHSAFASEVSRTKLERSAKANTRPTRIIDLSKIFTPALPA